MHFSCLKMIEVRCMFLVEHVSFQLQYGEWQDYFFIGPIQIIQQVLTQFGTHCARADDIAQIEYLLAEAIV